jgi:predicted extracellular nuclease
MHSSTFGRESAHSRFFKTRSAGILRRSRALLLALFGLVAFAPSAPAQVSLTSSYSQNFDGLANTGTANPWADNTTLDGWYAANSASVTTYRADTGTSNTGAVYSYGAAADTNRALGALPSAATATIYLALRMVNDTGAPLTRLAISYKGEQWRNGGSNAAQTMTFDYQVAAPGTVTAANTPSTGWNGVVGNPLDFPSPVSSTTAGALDGTAAANSATKTANVNVLIPDGQEIWLRWSIPRSASGSSNGLALDDLSVTASADSTPPAASGTAAPGIASPAGDAVTLTISIAPGANPVSTFGSASAVVAADLSAIGGSATQAFVYSTTDGSGRLLYTYAATVASGTSIGNKSLPITVTDDQGRTAAAASIALNVQNAESHSIMEIQGHGARSSFAGSGSALGTTYIKTPTGTGKNIVTAVGPSGFYMQDTEGDGDVTTSDGIYVFTGTNSNPALNVGDLVIVVGRIQEFSGSTEFAGSPAYTMVGHDDPSIPVAYDLSANPPNTDPGSGICTGPGSTIQTPSADGLTRNDGYQAANFACLDGMLVTMSRGIVNAPTFTTANSGTIVSPIAPNTGFYAVACGSSGACARSFRQPGILGSDANRTAGIPTFWGNPELIQIYLPGLNLAPSSLPAAPNTASGGIYNGGQEIQVTGVMSGFQSATMPDPTFEIYPRAGNDVTLIGAPSYPLAVSDPVAGKLTIGTQNMLHFFNDKADGADTSQYNDTCAGTGADDTCPTAAQYAKRLKKISLQIRTILKAPVVVAVQEAENYSVLTDIANQIHADDATLGYHPWLIPGNDPSGINVGILVRDGVTVNSMTQFYGDFITTACSGGGTCLLNDRPPVLLDAVYQGYPFRVLAIYDRSLSNLGVNDYVGVKRREEAEQVAAIVQSLQTDGGSVSGNASQDSSGAVAHGTFAIAGDAKVPVIVLGDFNAYEFSDGYVDVTGTILGTVDADPAHSVYPPTSGYVRPAPALFDTGSAVSQQQHYSYNFQGLLQEIDHIVLTSVGQADFISVQSGRGNSDISVASQTLTDDATPMRTSDHDGQVVTLGYVVTPNAGIGGAIDPATMQTVSSTRPIVFSVTADVGNDAQVTDNCGSGGAAAGSFDAGTNTYTIPAGVNTDCQVTAAFAPRVLVNGVCGSDDGQTLSSPPTQLCAAGTPTAVSGSGPWTWSCQGSGGGTTSACSASLLDTSTADISVIGKTAIANGDTSPSASKGTDFGKVPVGVQATQSFTIENLSTTDALTISAITSDNPVFTINGGTGVVAPGGSMFFTITFNANAAGGQSATIDIVSSSATAPKFDFAVRAQGIQAAAPIPAPTLGIESLLALLATLAAAGGFALYGRASAR